MRDPEALTHAAKNLPWRVAYRSWPPAGDLIPGYTLMLPVPADLPVFLYLALQNAALQDAKDRVETIVVPDQASVEFERSFALARAQFDVGPLRLTTPGRKAEIFRRIARDDPPKNYFLQIEAGVRAATSTHLLLHDADLFILDPRFLAEHYRRCAEQRLACLGVSPCWDNWLREHSFGHVVATWELMLDIGWLRSFAPWEHRGQHAWLDGEFHGFDVMLYTQARTSPERCRLHEVGDRFVHFNWVIGMYRQFRRGGVRPFRDRRFVLLLIRLLDDALRSRLPVHASPVDLPTVERLARGISDHTQPIIYSDIHRDTYHEFRGKLDRILSSPLFGDATAEMIDRAIRPFDVAYDYVLGSSAKTPDSHARGRN
jgi:hypothetical protein